MSAKNHLCMNCMESCRDCQCDEKEFYSDGDELICPYCRGTVRACDSEGALHDEATTEYDCGWCGEIFCVGVSVSYTWTTSVRK